MIIPTIPWIFGLSVATLVVQQIVKPRLPVYTLQVTRFPSLKYVHQKLLTQLTTDVALHNDNFVQIVRMGNHLDLIVSQMEVVWLTLTRTNGHIHYQNVHALMFDLFTPDWDGNLHHIGFAQDSQSVELAFDRIRRVPLAALWEIPPRADYATVDQIYVDITSFSKLLRSVSRLAHSWWRGFGSLLLPTTGVAFIKANGKTPFTVSLICDNVVNTWRLTIVGTECALHSLTLGWQDLDRAARRVRAHAERKLRADATGGVLTHPRQDWSDVARRLAWEEQMHTTV